MPGGEWKTGSAGILRSMGILPMSRRAILALPGLSYPTGGTPVLLTGKMPVLLNSLGRAPRPQSTAAMLLAQSEKYQGVIHPRPSGRSGSGNPSLHPVGEVLQ